MYKGSSHEFNTSFERAGLVLEYFLRSEKFNDRHTYSVRGLPRPVNDKYYAQIKLADPVFAAWGRKTEY